jgi:hypothetical protein
MASRIDFLKMISDQRRIMMDKPQNKRMYSAASRGIKPATDKNKTVVDALQT